MALMVDKATNMSDKNPYEDCDTLETHTRVPSYFRELVRFFTLKRVILEMLFHIKDVTRDVMSIRDVK